MRHLYKYDFGRQTLIFAQRPDAMAVATKAIWEVRMQRKLPLYWQIDKGGTELEHRLNRMAEEALQGLNAPDYARELVRYARYTAALQIASDGRLATPEEQQELAGYSGWGGIPQAFDENNTGWANEFAELSSLLDEDEYKSARASTPNAHYTSPEVIDAIYAALERFGFSGGRMLEPSVGVGYFFGQLPEQLQTSRLTGVELDSVSGRIAKQLYQKADIRIQGFESTDLQDDSYDAVIGNVPFGNYQLADVRYDSYRFLIHDYFFAKAIDKVRPGGFLIFVTTKGTLDKENSTLRRYLAKRANLIGAIRLPNNAFLETANTEVTTDILFLQKREMMTTEEPRAG